MKLVVLTGGVGGAKFLLGARECIGRSDFPGENYSGTPPSSITQGVIAIVNVGDDAWMHGVRIAPDLDSCMYTLGYGIDRERGWGRSGETFHAQEELAAYGAQPDWFGLGDRDLGTHLIRTHMLSAGYSLSEVTAALCKRWNPGVHLIPATNDRHETHVIVSQNPDDTSVREAIHFQQWWVKERAQLPTFGFVQVGVDNAQPTSGVLDHITSADVIFFAPSNPVVSIGAILSIPGIRGALRQTHAPIIGYSPVIGSKALRGMAEICLKVEGYSSTAYDIARYYGGRALGGLLDGWLVDTQDSDLIPRIATELRIEATAIPLLMTNPQATSAMVKAGIQLAAKIKASSTL